VNIAKASPVAAFLKGRAERETRGSCKTSPPFSRERTIKKLVSQSGVVSLLVN